MVRGIGLLLCGRANAIFLVGNEGEGKSRVVRPSRYLITSTETSDSETAPIMPTHSIIVRAQWDPEAKVWVATSDDVPGLVTEAETPDELERKLQVIIPELLEANGISFGEGEAEVPLYVMSEQVSRVRVRL